MWKENLMCIEKLKQIKKVIQICDAKYVYDYKLEFMQRIINIFEEQEYKIINANREINKLKQAQTYHPNKEELEKLKIGLTD